MRRVMCCAVFGMAASSCALAQPVFEVTLPEGNDLQLRHAGRHGRMAPQSSRLVVSLIHEDSRLFGRADPSDGPFFSDPQPMFGIDLPVFGRDLRLLKTGKTITLPEITDGFPGFIKDLPFGTYKAQAVLDMRREDSSWQREPGNVFSHVVTFTYENDAPVVKLVLDQVVDERELPEQEGVEWAKLFVLLANVPDGRRQMLNAGVVLPKDHDATRKYPAVYIIPGFGGDHTSASFYARALKSGRMGDDWTRLHEQAFVIVLDPESGNGHHLFVNSDVNGPMADVLVDRFIPYLEKRFGMIDNPSARIVTGHSSGGWSSLWLAIKRPDIFGACFSSAPDPVDFKFFQQVNIYEDESMYVDAEGNERASSTRNGEVTMTIREENLMEEVLGPGNTSGQQWDSWFAAFGPSGEGMAPAALHDVWTGTIDKEIAQKYKRFDITARVRAEPDTYGPRFAKNVRLIVGREDTYDLDLAVESLLSTLTEVGVDVNADDAPGYIKIIDGADHGSIRRTEAGAAFPREMLEFFQAGGHTKR